MNKITIFRVITAFVFLWIVTFIANAQYSLEWDEHQYLALPDPPYKGYIERATWNVNNNNLTFKEADEAGAIIYPNHYFEGTSTVTCDYRYEYYRNGNYHTAIATARYTISFKSVEAVLDNTEIELNIGDTKAIKGSFPGVKYMHGNPEMKWSSSNEKIVIVSGSGSIANPTGNIKAVGSGEAKVTLDPVIGPPVSCIVKVAYISPNKVELSPNPLKVTMGKSKNLKTTFSPDGASAKKVTWESANTSIATVSATGLVKGVAEGKTTITATTDNGISATAEIQVLPQPTSVALPASISIPLGYSKTITPTVQPVESETLYKWVSSDGTIASVSAGKITSKRYGTAIVTVTTENGKAADCEVHVEKTSTELDYRNATSKSKVIESLVKRSLKKY